ncbi:MAG TPA: hypothetical protein VJR02_23580 [Pyrinomonadaceae bacterium]|nr:hypothetical protein [Pyrinomonadaceae bacterium]
MSAGKQENNATSNDDTDRVGTFIDTRGVTNSPNTELAPVPADEDVMRGGLQIDARAVVGRVENETVQSDRRRDTT